MIFDKTLEESEIALELIEWRKLGREVLNFDWPYESRIVYLEECLDKIRVLLGKQK